MGGCGSTRWAAHFTARTTSDCMSLDMKEIARAGRLYAGYESHMEWSNGSTIGYGIRRNEHGLELVLNYWQACGPEGKKTDVEEFIPLESTRPYFGGIRWWARCPFVNNGRPCRRRVRKLYLAPGCPYFGCRACHRLVYASSQRHDKTTDARLMKLFAEVYGRDLDPDLHANLPPFKEELRDLKRRLCGG